MKKGDFSFLHIRCALLYGGICTWCLEAKLVVAEVADLFRLLFGEDHPQLWEFVTVERTELGSVFLGDLQEPLDHLLARGLLLQTLLFALDLHSDLLSGGLVTGDLDDVGVVHRDLEQFRQPHDLLLTAACDASGELLALLLRLRRRLFRLGQLLTELGHSERVVVRVVVRNVEDTSVATQLLAKLLLFELPLSYAFLSRTGGSGRHSGFLGLFFELCSISFGFCVLTVSLFFVFQFSEFRTILNSNLSSLPFICVWASTTITRTTVIH